MENKEKDKAVILIAERISKADPMDQAFLFGYLEGAANQKEKTRAEQEAKCVGAE